MKAQKVSRIGIVVSDGAVRAVQRVDGELVRAQVPCSEGDLTRSLRKLISSSPFIGRNVVIGLEGKAVLVESLVMPAGGGRNPESICTERLKGDPVFNAEHAALGVAVAGGSASESAQMVMLAAVDKERIAEVMQCCRDTSLEVHAVEAGALAAWRAYTGVGLQVRLLRGERQDVVQAGLDGRLSFCRVVSHPIPMTELGATITRAASLLGGRFERLTVSGPVDAELAALSRNLGLELAQPDEDLEDPAATGLATEGPILTEFTPPEERELRARRRVRKVRFGMVSAGLALLLVAGVLGFQRLSTLRQREAGLETEIKNRTEAAQELQGLRERLGAVQAADVRIEDAIPGHRTSGLWALLVNTAGAGTQLETVTIEDSAAPQFSRSSRQLAIEIAGLAADGEIVRSYADALLASGAFTDVRVKNSVRLLLEGGAEGERFKIAAMAETR